MIDRRATDKKIDEIVLALNRALGRPVTTWRAGDGEPKGNVGNLFVTKADNNRALLVMTDEAGDALNVFGCGMISKSSFYFLIAGFLSGVQHTQVKEPKNGQDCDTSL